MTKATSTRSLPWKDNIAYSMGNLGSNLIFALLSFTMKAGLALGGAITAFGLDSIGYIPGVAQSPEALGKLLILCTLVPLVFRIPVWGAMHFYNLSEKQFAQILTELDFKTNVSKEKLLETQ
jgi:Na+/melibiose symporter-like transporter